jgi:hypothetical protein
MSIFKISKALVIFSLFSLTAAFGNEPSALEIKQIQTRVFKIDQRKFEAALIEFCENLGGRQNRNNGGMLPWKAECTGSRQHYKGRVFAWRWELDKHPDGMLLRLRVFTYEKNGQLIQTFEPLYYEALFSGLADALVLNDIGVEVKVFQ